MNKINVKLALNYRFLKRKHEQLAEIYVHLTSKVASTQKNQEKFEEKR